MNPRIFRKNLLIPFLKILTDAFALESAFVFSYYLRFQSPIQYIFPVTKGYPPFEQYFIASLFLTAVYITLYSFEHSYRTRFFSSFVREIPVLLKTCFLGILVAMSVAFLYREFSYSRLTFFFMFINTNIFGLVARYVFHRFKRNFLIPKGYSVQKLILVGSAKTIPYYYSQIQGDKNQFFEILGYFSEKKIDSIEISHLGRIQDMSALIKQLSPDALLLTFEASDDHKVLEILEISEGRNIELFFIPNILNIITSRTSSFEIVGTPVIRLKSVAFSGWQGFIKRSFDLLLSFIGLLLLSPLLFLISCLIKISSKGTIFYRQKRVGLDGKEFTMFKFRSMIVDAESKTGPIWAKENDPRVTWIGKILRKSSLDELPQLINVLKGEMSLVGPRPERKIFVDEFQQSIPKYAERHRVRSGVTGWAQVNGLRGQSPIEDRTRYDVFYIENWSLWFDIKIILMTIMAIVRGENAY
ncbi:MAG: undecaprenyl-phosphate glucose phosphotransferase [Calditrichia bacterium]|nr:undecaprenyl-phosphate glucose phosphotransferase [Calditrichia bacterium]